MTTIAYVMTETMDDGSDRPTPVFVSESSVKMIVAVGNYLRSCMTGDGDHPEFYAEAQKLVDRVCTLVADASWTPSLWLEVEVPELGRTLLFNSAIVA